MGKDEIVNFFFFSFPPNLDNFYLAGWFQHDEAYIRSKLTLSQTVSGVAAHVSNGDATLLQVLESGGCGGATVVAEGGSTARVVAGGAGLGWEASGARVTAYIRVWRVGGVGVRRVPGVQRWDSAGLSCGQNRDLAMTRSALCLCDDVSVQVGEHGPGLGVEGTQRGIALVTSCRDVICYVGLYSLLYCSPSALVIFIDEVA